MPVYLYLIIFTIFFPLVLSFDRRVNFVQYWRYLFPATLVSAVYFLIWDYFFTSWGVWGFNTDYLLGPHLANLPLEEVLFFFVVPYACLFIYECIRHYAPKDYLISAAPYISGLLVVGLPVVAFFYWGHLYTTVTFVAAAVFVLLAQFILRVGWMGWFYLSYLVCLIPFLLVNGVLTALPVVWYNDAHNLGIRIYTIPLDDTVYCLLLLIMNVLIFEWLKKLGGVAKG